MMWRRGSSNVQFWTAYSDSCIAAARLDCDTSQPGSPNGPNPHRGRPPGRENNPSRTLGLAFVSSEGKGSAAIPQVKPSELTVLGSDVTMHV